MSDRLHRVIDLWVIFWSFVFFLGVSINFAEIVMRMIFSYSFDLMYDLPVWCTVWATLMVSGPVLLDGEHVSIDAVVSLLRGRAGKTVSVFNAVMTAVFGLVVTYGGVSFVCEMWRFDTTYPRSIPVPSWLVEACVPLGLFIFSVCAIYDVYRKIMAKYDGNTE